MNENIPLIFFLVFFILKILRTKTLLTNTHQHSAHIDRCNVWHMLDAIKFIPSVGRFSSYHR